MPWKNEIDRLVSHCVVEGGKEGGDKEAALQTLKDLIGLAPERSASWFHVGTAREIYGDGADSLPAAPSAEAERWEMLGRLDSSSRRGNRERVKELMGAPAFEGALVTPAGRVALRSVGRMLLRDGEVEQAFSLYQRHLAAVPDEGSRRDAEFLLEEALRRADRGDDDAGDSGALAHLDRAARFVKETGLDARAGAKVDRKLGRLHQLGQRWPEAVACYRRALEHLPKDDPYRSVLVGDLALATLGVRGTLDLLPVKDRPNTAEAETLLRTEGNQGEGRSYNALYTLGMLAYERGEHGPAAAAFREADALMRENRAKARIVHARARFFLGHCLVALGAQGPELEEASKLITKDASPAALDPALKETVFQALTAVMPDVRLPGRGQPPRERGERGERGDRAERGDRPPRREREARPEGAPADGRGEPRAERGPRPERGERGDRGGSERGDRGERREREPRREPLAARPPQDAAGFLAEARRVLASDPHRALEHVDRAFKSRPDFETWFGAYRTRLEALVALGERDETLQTYERFRAKLYQRAAYDRLEALLLDPAGPLKGALGEAAWNEELVELYEVMPGRGAQLVAAAQSAAAAHLQSQEPARVARALALLREAAGSDPAGVAPQLASAREAAARLGVAPEPCRSEDCRQKLAARATPARLLVVGGDEGRRPHLDRLKDLSQRLGFQGDWVFTGARPPLKTLKEIEDSARGAHAILLHHGAGPELRQEVRRLGQALAIPVREATWLGAAGVEEEVVQVLSHAFAPGA